MADHPPPDRRPSLFDLWTSYHFDIPTLAREARVSEDIVHAVLGNKPVTRKEAEKVLAQVSLLLHQKYTLETVYVSLLAERHISEVASLMKNIDEQYLAAQRGLSGLSQGTTRHDFITHRMENMYDGLQQVYTKYGEEVAIQALIEWQDRIASETNIQ